MTPVVITHRLDLVLRLLDTTTGRDVSATEVSLYRGDELLHPQERERGTMIFPGLGRNDFTLSLRSRSFEPVDIPVCYEQLDEKIPLLELQLIPIDNSLSPMPCRSISGTLPGIGELTAVRLGDTSCLAREFEPRKKLMTVFNPHCLELTRTHYALLDPDAGRFEPFKIVRQADEKTLKLDRVIESEFGSTWPVCPIVFGRTDADGHYLLRVRNDAVKSKWLLRYTLGGEVFFFTADMSRDTELPPAGGAADAETG